MWIPKICGYSNMWVLIIGWVFKSCGYSKHVAGTQKLWIFKKWVLKISEYLQNKGMQKYGYPKFVGIQKYGYSIIVRSQSWWVFKFVVTPIFCGFSKILGIQ